MRRKNRAELDEIRARTQLAGAQEKLADAQEQHTIADTLGLVTQQLHEVHEELLAAEMRQAIMELQIQRARAKGFIDEVRTGKSRNPAA
jgi:hypothetical protein